MYKSKNSRNGERKRQAWLGKAERHLFKINKSPDWLDVMHAAFKPGATPEARQFHLDRMLVEAKATYEFLLKHDPASVKDSLQCALYLQEKAKGNV